MPKVIWGVDSAAAVDQQLYDCVVNNFGQPDVWGRYLNTIPNVSDGLTKEEINFLKGKGVKILPIYNNFTEAIGAKAGKVAAQNALFNAKRLGVPKGVFIFANVERFFDVDPDWILGWVERMINSDYRPGIYFDPIEGPFNEAYCEAVVRNRDVFSKTVLWSAEPESGISTKRDFPTYSPAVPNCEANVWAWQYGRDAEECPIDTILVQQRLFESLY
ncbi:MULTISPECIES: glycoside hydrolase domain-containing protein [Bacillaceae]|uniref:DUF1906 domain-containing protein n=1 Tax=Evansella alkalicola TaxID=745819 RepID=A0ABS6JZF9_9BACI|nr:MULTISPECIES: glycoside hydrolase domain-containing protein [Bacillaceae]MBU9723607.1 DUF1906 domain-containing protein [Bacillus alkalicola]